MSEYWREHAEIAMDEAKLEATDDQLDTIAGVIESAHEFYGQAMGHDVASTNWHANNRQEIEDLKKEVQAEKAKEICPECRGARVLHTYGGTMVGTSDCWKCHGDGRI